MFLLLLQHVLNKQPAKKKISLTAKLRCVYMTGFKQNKIHFTELHDDTLFKQPIVHKF